METIGVNAVSKVGAVALIVVVIVCCFSIARGADFPSGSVVVSETAIFVDLSPVGTLYAIYFDGYSVALPDSAGFYVFDGLEENESHRVMIVYITPQSVYAETFITESHYDDPDYIPLVFLFLVFLLCLYLSTRLWVFLAPSALISLVIIYFVRDGGYLWIFEVLGALCFVCTAVVGSLLLAKTRK